MIDLQKALNDTKSAEEALKIKLLTSKAVILEVLKAETNVNINCCDVFRRCLEELKTWHKRHYSTNQEIIESASTIGWLNLLACLCQNTDSASVCDNCVSEVKKANNKDLYSHVIGLFLLAKNKGQFYEAILNQNIEKAKSNPIAAWKRRRVYWEEALNGKQDNNIPLSRTTLGQTLIMHLLEVTLPFYENEHRVMERGTLTVLLVPLLRAVFRHSDSAHLVYSHFFQGLDNIITSQPRPFHMLYRQELGVIEEFKSRDTNMRASVIAEIKDAASDENKTLPLTLQERANTILHGTSDAEPSNSPFPKMNRISQITCLIRQMEEGSLTKGISRLYRPHLVGIHYREAQLLDGKSPGAFSWKNITDTTKKRNFEKAVKARYKYGHGLDFLEGLFGKTDKTPLPVWVQDGEVSFLLLLTALKQTKEHTNSWIFKKTKTDIQIPAEIITGKDQTGPGFSVGYSLDEFTKIFGLFRPKGEWLATPKVWTLINFLQRAAIRNFPEQYTETSDLGKFAKVLYENILNDNKFTMQSLRKACAAVCTLQEWRDIPDIDTLVNKSRLPTFLLECILRKEQFIPYSLFFYPITFDKLGDRTIPGAFLGGTFAGLEWDCYPSVTDRQNYHLFAALDAIRPIIDFEIGRVLKEEKDEMMNVRAKERQETISIIKPSVEQMTQLFRQAGNLAYKIESAIDPDWSGLFSPSGVRVINPIFDTNETCLLTDGLVGEEQEFEPFHSFADNDLSKNMLPILTYLLRKVDEAGLDRNCKVSKNYDEYKKRRTELRAPRNVSAPPISYFSQSDIFRNPFLNAYALAASSFCLQDSKERVKHLLALLKILAVDSGDAPKGVFVVQIVTALACQKAGNSDERCNRMVCFDGQRPIMGSFAPMNLEGVMELVSVIEADPVLNSGTHKYDSTRDLMAKGMLPGDLPAARFLRALGILAGEALGTNVGPSLVSVKAWVIDFQKSGRIVIRLDCANTFTPKVRELIWKKIGNNDFEGYHNLRDSIKVIAEGLRCSPRFIKASIPKRYTPEGDCSFEIVDDLNGKDCSIFIVLPLSEERVL